MNVSRILAVLLLCLPLFITACTHKPTGPVGVKIGKPYQVGGRWYNPAYDPHYEETGIASWYGPGFHGKYTSSGETFNENAMTAAHRTLPMPSMVRVTNLDNGRSAVVRVNDRGPFHSDRIIDLSKAAARELGILGTGTARVKLTYLKKETNSYLIEQNIPGKEKILLAEGNTPDEPDHSGWSLISNAYADEGDKIVPPDATTVVTVDSHDVPAIKPVYRVESNQEEPRALNDMRHETYPVQQASYSPFVPPVGSQQNPQAAAAAPGSLSQAMDIAGEERVITPASYTQAPPVNADALYVLAGTYGQKENAEAMTRKLSRIGAQLTPMQTSSGKVLYRVLLGPFASREETTPVRSRLRDMGIKDAQVTRQ